MLRRLLLFLTMGLLVFAVTVDAQTGVEACRVSPAKDYYYWLAEADFEGCLDALYSEMTDRGDSEIYGDWAGATDIHIDANGDIYTADAGSNDWTEWGSFTSDSSDTSDTSETSDGFDTNTTTALSMEEVFGLVEKDLSEFWRGVFQEQGMGYQQPELILWEGYEMDTRCGIVPSEAGPLYCPFDATIYFPVDFSEWLYSMGDFAVAAAIAHEWGHAVQDQAGILGNVETIESELQADCFAGAYAEYITNRSELLKLEEGDIQEGADTFFTLGDPEDTDWFDPRAHGSGRQREQAFETGVQQGYDAC